MKETVRTTVWDTKKRQSMWGPYRRPSVVSPALKWFLVLIAMYLLLLGVTYG